MVHDLHDLLRGNRDELLRRCDVRSQARHPDRSIEERLDSMPSFIDELILALTPADGGKGGDPAPHRTCMPEAARAHGEQRYRLGYPIEEITWDYAMIADVIAELAIEHDTALDAYRALMPRDDGDARVIRPRAMQRVIDGDHGVQRDPLGPGHRSQQDREHARAQPRAARGLIDQTLAAVRLDAGARMHPSTQDLAPIVDEIVAGAYNTNSVRIDVNVPEKMQVFADRQLLYSALSNLVQNAIKFTPPGGPVEVRASTEINGVQIDVEDECGGLPEGDPEALFSPFRQGRRLAITRAAIDAHGGSVHVRNLPGRGCIFTMWLPCSAAP